jgi:hypothetical protein
MGMYGKGGSYLSPSRSGKVSCYSLMRCLADSLSRVLQSDILSFTPPLPASKRDTINKFDMSVLNRVMLRFPYPFWGNDTYTLGFLPQHSEIFEDATDDDDDDDEWATVPLFSVAVNAGYEDRPVGSGGVLTFMTGGDSGDNLLA